MGIGIGGGSVFILIFEGDVPDEEVLAVLGNCEECGARSGCRSRGGGADFAPPLPLSSK